MPNWKIAFALVAAVELATGSPGWADVAGCPLFPRDNIWNARVDSLPVDPRSDDYIATIGRGPRLHPDFGVRDLERRPDRHPVRDGAGQPAPRGR